MLRKHAEPAVSYKYGASLRSEPPFETTGVSGYTALMSCAELTCLPGVTWKRGLARSHLNMMTKVLGITVQVGSTV